MFSFSGFSGTYTAAHVIAPDGADGGWQWARTSVAAGSYVATPVLATFPQKVAHTL